MENISQVGLEAEIAELSRQIEEKKKVLENGSGIVRERELVSETIAEHFYASPSVSPVAIQDDTTALPAQPIQATKPKVVSDDYLNALPNETVEQINSYISMIPSSGIRPTITKLQQDNPFIIDAFHDALVTRLYEELKARGIIRQN